MASERGLPTPPRSSQDPGPSSSQPASPSRPLRKRAKPTVTPRSFRRFFTPRNTTGRDQAREVLGDITFGSVNARACAPEPLPAAKRQVFDEDENPPQGSNIFNVPDLPYLSPHNSPSRQYSAQAKYTLKRKRHAVYHAAEPPHFRSANVPPPRQFTRASYWDALGSLSMRESGLVRNSYDRRCNGPSAPWQSLVASFYTQDADIHRCQNLAQGGGNAYTLPFCVAPCHTNSLVAVGDEEGYIRLLDTQQSDTPHMHKPYLAFQQHGNAIMDMDFSEDDYHLATASGDQTGLVIDMRTQQPIYYLKGHAASLKQIRFQPGSGHSVIATSSRDGSVNVWDLRCKGSSVQRPDLVVSLGGVDYQYGDSGARKQPLAAACVGTIPHAHSHSSLSHEIDERTSRANSTFHATRQASQKARQLVSVTAISFLSASRPHLLLSGSEADATVKVWDLRAKQPFNGKKWHPLSTTRQPEAHTRYRKFGMSSMTLSNDNSRLYTLCKDHTVYAYSLEHLILGTAPELGPSSSWKRRSETKMGVGPLYALQHPQLKASSFYIKSALRPCNAANANAEVLAVGSTESCAVLFPTEPQSGKDSWRGDSRNDSGPFHARPSLATRCAGQGSSDLLPVSRNGVALIRGHEKEVTGLNWTANGELVTVGDDLRCCVWREDAETARSLRMEGEAGGKRWGMGWADVDGSWDENE